MSEPLQQMLSTIDERVAIEGRPLRDTERLSKKLLLTIKCAGCGEVLAYSNDEERGVNLAVHNCTMRPCCEMWAT